MKKIRKVLLVSLFLIFVLLILFIIQSFIMLFCFGYNEKPANKNLLYQYSINETIVDQVKIEKFYIDRFRDSILILSFNKNYIVVLWKLEQYKNLELSEFGLNNISNLKRENIKGYELITPENSNLPEIETKIILTKKAGLNLSFNGGSILEQELSDEYFYLLMYCNRIGLISRKNIIDLIISYNRPLYSSLLIHKSNKGFYLIICYSLNNDRIEKDDFLRIFNF